jgi:hypothetical protein
MVQRPPRSIRLSQEDERLSMKAAEDEGLTWHGWVTHLIRKALLKKRPVDFLDRSASRRRRSR